jgi:hypothetical protein
VELLTQLIHNTCNQIKASWLQSQHFISYGKLLIGNREAVNGKTLRNITLPNNNVLSPFTSIDQHDGGQELQKTIQVNSLPLSPWTPYSYYTDSGDETLLHWVICKHRIMLLQF